MLFPFFYPEVWGEHDSQFDLNVFLKWAATTKTATSMGVSEKNMFFMPYPETQSIFRGPF